MTPQEEQVESILVDAKMYAESLRQWRFKVRHAMLDEPVDREVLSFWVAHPSPWSE